MFPTGASFRRVARSTRFMVLILVALDLSRGEKPKPIDEFYFNHNQSSLCGTSFKGLTLNKSSPYIIGGDDVLDGEFPMVVLVTRDQGERHCTGVIYRSDVVLTSASCTFNYEERRLALKGVPPLRAYIVPREDPITVSVGSIQFRGGDHRQEHSVTFVIRGTGVGPYFASGDEPDFARLFLKKPIQFNNHTQPVCVINDWRINHKLMGDGRCYVVGFGVKNSRPQIYNKVAQKHQVAPTDCLMKEKYSICFRSPKWDEKDKGICLGDTGAPLMCLDRHSRWSMIAMAEGTYNEKLSEGNYRRRECIIGQPSRIDANIPDIYLNITHMAGVLEGGIDEARKVVQKIKAFRSRDWCKLKT